MSQEMGGEGFDQLVITRARNGYTVNDTPMSNRHEMTKPWVFNSLGDLTQWLSTTVWRGTDE